MVREAIAQRVGGAGAEPLQAAPASPLASLPTPVTSATRCPVPAGLPHRTDGSVQSLRLLPVAWTLIEALSIPTAILILTRFERRNAEARSNRCQLAQPRVLATRRSILLLASADVDPVIRRLTAATDVSARRCRIDLLKSRAGQGQGRHGLPSSRTRSRREVLDAAPDLKVVVEHRRRLREYRCRRRAKERGIVVTNTPDVLTEATAELTWA